jgi:cyclopropane-fatty-acyl-phospholipid synthase
MAARDEIAASEIGFRYAGHMVFWLQLAKRVDAAPITRTYVEQDERRYEHGARSVA